MTQQIQYRSAALPVRDRGQSLCAAWLLAALLVAAPAVAIGASHEASETGDAKDAHAAGMTDHGKKGEANAAGGAPEVMKDEAARAGGVAGAVDEKTYERIIPRKGVGELMAVTVLDAHVISGDGENIGEVDDILIGQDGQVRALVVEVGGILGLGEKPVAVRYDRFEQAVNDDGMLKLTLEATVEELKAAPKFIPFHEVRQ